VAADVKVQDQEFQHSWWREDSVFFFFISSLLYKRSGNMSLVAIGSAGGAYDALSNDSAESVVAH
jgi:hypothetical protein